MEFNYRFLPSGDAIVWLDDEANCLLLNMGMSDDEAHAALRSWLAEHYPEATIDTHLAFTKQTNG